MDLLSSNVKGDINELSSMRAFISRGFTVSVPFGGRGRYDFVAEKFGRFIRVQCKACHEEEKRTISLRAVSSYDYNGKNVMRTYTKEQIDVYATEFENKVYVIPMEEESHTKAFTGNFYRRV